MFDPLVLDAAPESLWLDFQSERRLPPRLPRVVDCWRRSRNLGAPYEGPKPEEVLVRGPDLALRRGRVDEVLASGQGVLERVAAAAEQCDFQLLLSDMDGVIVWSAGGGEFAATAKRVRLMAGASWSEEARGTNAIGTALAEDRPVFVSGSAHFARAYHELVCYAAPVHDVNGEVVAVLDATSTLARADAAVGVGVVSAAQALEELLRMRAYANAGATVTRALAHSLERMRCPVAVIEPPGRVARFNAPAREIFGETTRVSLERLLGVDFATLARHAQTGVPLDVESPISGRSHRLRLEPIESGGRLLALLTFLEDVPVVRGATSRSTGSRSTAPRAADAPPFAEIFAQDERTRASLRWAARIARSDIPVMLLAETGAGKELMARGLHRASERRDGPFVAVNCGSVAASLLESELFGYGPGAFTGASERGRDGYFHAASGGTLFLDEVAEMPVAMQAMLLRVLETGIYHRVGETQPRRADIRLLCATCRDLPEMVATKTFREDLYYRLKGATVTLPPLRERQDVLALAGHLLVELAAPRGILPTPTLSEEVAAFFASYAWPGNVRELKSTLEVALVLAEGAATIELDHLPPDLPVTRAEPDDDPGADSGAEPTLADAQRQAVRRVLAEVAGNVSLAAKRLGVARSTLYRMMRRYGLR
ncbi:MAG: sigma-54-dependent Fis family transcriptional regulator [Myxococcales bacterium]|nr:sigma-54-dependent Fis family transcriptional regulator [Myxococcales bacterium]